MLLKSKDGLIKVLIHLLTWALIIYLLFRYPILGRKSVPYPEDFLIKQIVHMALMVLGFYANTYYFVPKLLLGGRPVRFLGGLIAFVLLSSFALSMVDSYLEISLRMEQTHGKRIWSIPYMDSFGLFTSLFVLGISTSIAVTRKWNIDRIEREAYQRQQVETELGFLKAQIHPHFFFNTLNSIYALTFTDVEASRKVLTKLSRMMRYLLYETQQDNVPLDKEIALIADYIGIMKLRVNSNTLVIYTAPETSSDKLIAPMLLLPYVENAFKHGISDSEISAITISIALNDKGIVLRTKNYISGNNGGLYEKSSHSGIGSVNTLRRLELLYKDNYSLDTSVNLTSNEYQLYLSINLS